MTYRVLYSDDLTHIGTCESPYRKKGEVFREEMIVADVDEVADAGADVHMLQPGLGWTPLWQSKVYPFDEHYAWAKERYGCPDSIFDAYMLAGGDIVRAFVNRCRQRGTTPFISLRMNDYHGKELLDFSRDQLRNATMPMTLCASRFQEEHREWRIGPEPEETKGVVDEAPFLRDRALRTRTRHARVLDWAIPEVREHKFAFIQELCENYDIDGFELDFMRGLLSVPARHHDVRAAAANHVRLLCSGAGIARSHCATRPGAEAMRPHPPSPGNPRCAGDRCQSLARGRSGHV